MLYLFLFLTIVRALLKWEVFGAVIAENVARGWYYCDHMHCTQLETAMPGAKENMKVVFAKITPNGFYGYSQGQGE